MSKNYIPIYNKEEAIKALQFLKNYIGLSTGKVEGLAEVEDFLFEIRPFVNQRTVVEYPGVQGREITIKILIGTKGVSDD